MLSRRDAARGAVLTLILLSLFCRRAAAQAPVELSSPFTLADALSLAEQRNPELAEDVERLRASEARPGT